MLFINQIILADLLSSFSYSFFSFSLFLLRLLLLFLFLLLLLPLGEETARDEGADEVRRDIVGEEKLHKIKDLRMEGRGGQ